MRLCLNVIVVTSFRQIAAPSHTHDSRYGVNHTAACVTPPPFLWRVGGCNWHNPHWGGMLWLQSRAVMVAGGSVRQGVGTVDIGIKKMMVMSRTIILNYYNNIRIYL
ncbi:MAG: hypothetical protein IMF18_11900 [Proteobacteria bacterium]|nr:hypothetical protein [Pseudomonadota bacterium]